MRAAAERETEQPIAEVWCKLAERCRAVEEAERDRLTRNRQRRLQLGDWSVPPKPLRERVERLILFSGEHVLYTRVLSQLDQSVLCRVSKTGKKLVYDSWGPRLSWVCQVAYGIAMRAHTRHDRSLLRWNLNPEERTHALANLSSEFIAALQEVRARMVRCGSPMLEHYDRMYPWLVMLAGVGMIIAGALAVPWRSDAQKE